MERHGEPLELNPLTEEGTVDLGTAAAGVAQLVRVYGLLPVVLGRDDLVTATQGSHLVWGELVNLCLLLDPETSRMGALSKAQRLIPEHRELLLGLPGIQPDRTSIIAFHEAAWCALLKLTADGPLAGASWPPVRTLEHLKAWLDRTLGLAVELP